MKRILEHFNTSVKPLYDPTDDDGESTYQIPIPGARDLPKKGLEDGYLQLTKYKSPCR